LNDPTFPFARLLREDSFVCPALLESKMVPRSIVLCGLSSVVLLLGTGGCVLSPKGTNDEARKLADSNRYQKPFDQRDLPDVPINPDWRDVLRRAFYSSGEVESAYFDWAAAMARIQQRAAWPNVNVSLSFEYMSHQHHRRIRSDAESLVPHQDHESR
jgi:hypothetical protein